jgi:hypothetical protein
MSELTAPYKWIWKRDNKQINWQLTKNGVAYDLTNVHEITITVRESDTESAAAVFTCTKTGGDVVVQSATNGTMHAVVIPVDTSSADAGRKVYDIEVEDETSKINTFGKGVFEIKQDISHA